MLILQNPTPILGILTTLFTKNQMGKPYMPLMMGDWIRGTRTMKAQVKGVYIGLLIHQYDNGFLPADLETLALIEPEVAQVWVILKDKFEEFENGKLRNIKLEEIKAFWNKQGQNGKKGGRPKKNKPKRNPNNNPKANPNHNLHNDLDIDNDIILNNKESKQKIEIVMPFDAPAFVSLWATWKQYRKEIGKPYRSQLSEQAALKQLAKYNAGEAIQMIEQAIANSWQGIFPLKNQSNGKPTQQQKFDSAIDRANHYANNAKPKP